MIVPSIDIMNGSTVQLIGGEAKALDAGDPRPVARQFSMLGELAVIDLDAALGQGSNSSVIEELVRQYPCRVGGGIRDYDTAVRWLDKGAGKIIIGTAAAPELLSRLPRERLIVALDCRHGDVVVDGWKTNTGKSVENRIEELREFTGGFLVTFVEREGRMQGIDLEAARRLKGLVGDVDLTVAGGVTTADEIRELDQHDIDAQVGMAIYTDRLSLVDAFLAPVNPNQTDSLWPTVVVDEQQTALGLVWSNRKSVSEAIRLKAGVYHSRQRGLWIKGESSGNRQELLRVELDCDRDALRFVVRQHGDGFCHTGRRSCWGDDAGLTRLWRRLVDRMDNAPDGSYTLRLLNDSKLLESKLIEEAHELTEANARDEVVGEAADLLYFTMVKLLSAGAKMYDLTKELDRRELIVTRRSGDAKPERNENRE